MEAKAIFHYATYCTIDLKIGFEVKPVYGQLCHFIVLVYFNYLKQIKIRYRPSLML